MIDWSLFRWSKGVASRVLRRRKQGRAASALTQCYATVDQRDGGLCRFPGCYRPATAHHHLVFRSKAKRRIADPTNVIVICLEHHIWIHDRRWISVSGQADEAVTWAVTGLGRRQGLLLPYTVTHPTSHLSPVRTLGNVERDPSRLSESPALGQAERQSVARPVPRA